MLGVLDCVRLRGVIPVIAVVFVFVFVFRAFPRVAITAQSFYIATCGYVHDKTFVSKKTQKKTHTHNRNTHVKIKIAKIQCQVSYALKQLSTLRRDADPVASRGNRFHAAAALYGKSRRAAVKQSFCEQPWLYLDNSVPCIQAEFQGLIPFSCLTEPDGAFGAAQQGGLRRHRRGTLRQPVGPRLSSHIPQTGPPAKLVPQGALGGPHRHSLIKGGPFKLLSTPSLELTTLPEKMPSLARYERVHGKKRSLVCLCAAPNSNEMLYIGSGKSFCLCPLLHISCPCMIMA